MSTKIPLKLVATRNMRVGMRSVSVGETFTAKNEAEARYLMNIKKACTPEEWSARQNPDAGGDGAADSSKMTVPELRVLAAEYGIETDGLKKAELVAAIAEAEAE